MAFAIEVDAHADLGLGSIPVPGGAAFAHDSRVIKGLLRATLTGIAVRARLIVKLFVGEQSFVDQLLELIGI